MAEEMVMSSSSLPSSSGSRSKSFRCLVESIHSLLGFKTQLNSTWADSVCNIIKTLPSESPSPPPPPPHKDVDPGNSISTITGELAALNASIYQLNMQRRQLLNHFLDLKGNIRVFCRVRPIMMGESSMHLTPVVPFDSSTVLLNFANNKTKIYNFDKVFHPASSQDDIFTEVEPVIKSALDGYNACIFAYGQTGTGKTFTMEGTPDCPGIVPRTIEALFKQAADSNHKFLFHFSMLEMYMGHLKDLLIPQTKIATDPIPPRLSIQTDPKGDIEIENLVAIQVSDFNQAIRLYRLGCRFRSTASTNSNKASSRSHCMIRISITCFDATERQRVTNKIWMIDLGGSERVLKTKAWGRRFDEGKAINLSISALGDVIYALQRRRGHIPYRNSKLTQVLKDSLGEDSKTLMLVHVSPTEEDLCETVCSLNFATRARSIHLGNEEPDEARVQKEVAMTNLQQKMKQIEDKRDEVSTEIRKLNEKLENITRTSSSSNEAPHVPTEVPQTSTENLKMTATNVTAAARPSNIPRFMMPTVSSKRKTGIGQQTSKDEKELNRTRRRKPSSCRAESVTLPIKGSMSECNSEASVSRASCLVDLSGTNFNNVDNETECSQDTWDCDIKTEDHRSRRSSSSRQHMAHHSLKDNNGDGNTNKFISSKFLKVNHWLHLHKSASNTTSHYTLRNKRVLAIPVPKKKKSNSMELKIVEKLQDKKMHGSEFRKKEHEHVNIKKLTDEGITARFVSEKVTNVTPTVLKDPFPTRGCITTTNDLSNYLSIEGSKLTATKQVITDKRQCSEAFTSNSSLTSNITGSAVDNGIIDLIENEVVSIPRSKLNMHCQANVPTEMLTSREEEKLCISAQNSDAGITQFLYKLKFQRSLSMDKENWRDLSITISESLGSPKTGICDLLKEKIQILWTVALIGVGFQSFGFGNDFFHALIL